MLKLQHMRSPYLKRLATYAFIGLAWIYVFPGVAWAQAENALADAGQLPTSVMVGITIAGAFFGYLVDRKDELYGCTYPGLDLIFPKRFDPYRPQAEFVISMLYAPFLTFLIIQPESGSAAFFGGGTVLYTARDTLLRKLGNAQELDDEMLGKTQEVDEISEDLN